MTKRKPRQRDKRVIAGKKPGGSRIHWASLKAVGLFALYSAVGFFLIYNERAGEYVVAPFTDVVARAAGLIFHVFGADVAGQGSTLTVGDTSLVIAFGCNGIEALVIYIAALLASPFPWSRKPWGLLVGVVGNFIINQVRIIGIFLAAGISRQAFAYTHEIIGQTFVIVLTMALFLWWGSRYGRRQKGTSGPVLA
jgi:exosortase/archaeosortase family protein